MRTHYEVLGLSVDASTSLIRQTYHRLLQIYHPDHNSDPQAHRISAEIIEAYSVIGDPEKRAEYDSSQYPRGQVADSKPDTSSAVPHLEELVCQKCGVQDASLRFSVMTWVASAVFMTQRGGRGGLWCARCRTKQAAIWSTVSGLVGWWGFPWGPIYTLPALYENARGGKQDKSSNARLLRIVGFQLFEKQLYAEAHAALSSSLHIEFDEPTFGFMKSLPATEEVTSRSKARFYSILTAAPSILTTVIIIGCLIYSVNRPSGYAARYQKPKQNVTQAQQIPTYNSVRDEVNLLAGKLAEAVEVNATPVGSHQEGTVRIQDFELDRSRYQSKEFDQVSLQLEKLLSDDSANQDGFVASAYFNSRLMSLSITVLNEYSRGGDIRESIHQVESLSADNHIRSWLLESNYANHYLSLVTLLHNMLKHQTLGHSLNEQRSELQTLNNQIKNIKTDIQAARNDNDGALEHILVLSYNKDVERYNVLLSLEKQNRTIYYGVDLAFNKCLDPAILMGKFRQVNLTSEETNTSALHNNE